MIFVGKSTVERYVSHFLSLNINVIEWALS